jgi:hypothetical protein
MITDHGTAKRASDYLRTLTLCKVLLADALDRVNATDY